MAGDPWAEPSAKAWIDHVVNELRPKVEGSILTMQLLPSDEGEVKFWVELGASIMLDKPIIAIALGDRPIPPKLEKIADEIVRLPEGLNPGASDQLAAAIKRVVDRVT